MNSENLAVVIGDQKINHHQMMLDINAAEIWLLKNIDTSDRRFAVGIFNGYLHWIVVLALLKMGKSVVTIYNDSNLSPEFNTSINAWVFGRDRPGNFSKKIILNLDVIRQEISVNDHAEINKKLNLNFGENSERLILTSGTTGRSKVVVVSQADILKRLSVMDKNILPNYSEDTQMLHLMGMDTVGHFFGCIHVWSKGGTVLMGVPNETNFGYSQLPLALCNVLTVAPARLKELLDKTQGVWPGKEGRIIRVGGSRLHSVVRDEALRRAASHVEIIYGSTELGSVASCSAMELDQYPSTAGQLHPDVVVEIVDDQDHPMPFGQQGKIRCKTVGMAHAYEGIQSEEQFKDGWFYPGDIGTLSSDGRLDILGRVNDVINLGGTKISAVDIETKLLHSDQLQEGCVLGLDLAGTHNLAVAVVYSGNDMDLLREKIQESFGSNIPFHLIKLAALPRNAMGKIPREQISQKITQVVSNDLMINK